MYMRMKPDTLREEVTQILTILNRMKERLDEGIQGDEMPSNDVNVEVFQVQMHAEIMLASGRLATLAEVMEG